MIDFPHSLIEFQHGFPDECACAAYLADARWPDGFRCPDCGHDKSWELSTKAFTRECAGCGKQTSVTAGTVIHGSKLPLTVWFWAAYLMATHSNGIAALQLQKQLGLGSYKSAWLLCAKLRQAMVAPHRSPLAGLVEIDETVIPHRTKADPPAGAHGRSAEGKMLIAGAVEVHDGGPRRGGWRPSPTSPPRACTPSSKPTWKPAPPRKPTAGPATPALPALLTTRTSSDRWPRTSSCRGRIASSPTSRPGRSVSITGCARSTCNPISTSSLSSIAAAPDTPPSAPCSASPPPSNTSPTTS